MGVKWLCGLLIGLVFFAGCPRGNVTVAVVDNDTTRTLSIQSGLKGKFEVTEDSVLIRFYDRDEHLRATVTISDRNVARQLKDTTQDSILVNLNENKGSLVATKQGLVLNLIDPDNKSKLVVQLSDSGAVWSVYDSAGRLLWGRK
jgi:hypothetical protein